MPIPDPDHLVDQAERLLASPSPGPTRQVDIRRAISAAYYGIFHFICAALADQIVGATYRATARYGLVYRDVDHRFLRDLCLAIVRSTPTSKLAPYFPSGGFGRDMTAFATAVSDLQTRRHRADYDPMASFVVEQATAAVATGRNGVGRFRAAPAAERAIFLTLFLCPPR